MTPWWLLVASLVNLVWTLLLVLLLVRVTRSLRHHETMLTKMEQLAAMKLASAAMLARWEYEEKRKEQAPS